MAVGNIVDVAVWFCSDGRVAVQATTDGICASEKRISGDSFCKGPASENGYISV